MTAYYVNHVNGEVSEKYAEGDCTFCGKPRLQCAADLGDPYTKVEEN